MIDILVPLEQEGTTAMVRRWLKRVGDVVVANEPLVELETDKVAVEVAAPADGVIEAILLDADAEAWPGAVLGRLGIGAADTASIPSEAGDMPGPEPDAFPLTEEDRPLSPAVRQVVAAHRIDLAGIAGSGRGGRITRADVDRAVAERGPRPLPVTPPPFGPDPAPAARTASGAPTGGRSIVPHDRMRRRIAENMLNSVAVAPHVTAVFEADFSAILAHRQRHRPIFERQNANLTLTTYFVSAAVAAMRVVPTVNSRWFEDRLEIFHDINVGIGTALGDKGVIVPVMHRAQELSLLEIAVRLTELTARARESRLLPEDVRDGTFAISNHGVSGSLFATPIIIAQPQSAILGVGKLEKRVVVREVDGADAIQIRPLAYVSLTIDHRVLDGHQTNAWLSAFVEHLETWPQDIA